MSPSDFIFLEEIVEVCRIGTTPEERAYPQPVLVSLRIFLPLTQAGVSDDLVFSVDYAHAMGSIRHAITSRTYNLVEAVAEEIARVVLSYPHVTSVSVRVGKRVLPGVRLVGAEILRSRPSI